MSQTETIRGTMRAVDRNPDETTEDVCERLVRKYVDDFTNLENAYCVTYRECMYELVGGYAVYKDEVYYLGDYDELNGDDIFEATENADGSISYFVQYYNGGCGLEEAIGYALDKLKKS